MTGHILKLLALFIASTLLSLTGFARAQYPPGYPSQIFYWQRAQAPYTPGRGAVEGGPGNDPNPGSPMYVCRSQYEGSLQPGKWVAGNCNIAYGGREMVRSTFEIAYGNAVWLPYSDDPNGLIQTGSERDGTPLYSCRVRYRGGVRGVLSMPSLSGLPLGADLGYQPGKLLQGSCHVPLGGQEVVQAPPFEALYARSGYDPPYYPPAPQPAPSPTPTAIPYAQPGPTSVTWKTARAPFTPGEGAIQGGPGNGPKPGSPLYICRSGYNGALIPGKWIEGKCSIPVQGGEYKMDKYDVAYGRAKWAPFGGVSADLVQGGYEADGSPLYICRVPHFKTAFHDLGMQPGKLLGGSCHVPYANIEVPQDPPFEVLYSIPAEATASDSGTAVSGPSRTGLEVLFQAGTAAAAGSISVKNGATGVSVNKDLAPNLSAAQCVSILLQAAFEAGLQIQSEPGGKGLKVFGTNNSLHITGASVSVSQF